MATQVSRSEASEGRHGGPLAGIRIVDLSIALSGPWAVGILADQGADVVKVEPPGVGDIGRWVGPAIGGVSAMAQIANRGKRSIAVDLQKEAGRDVVRRLAARADVFVQNFRPGVIERLGLGYDALSAANPQLVYVSISGFEALGPYDGRVLTWIGWCRCGPAATPAAAAYYQFTGSISFELAAAAGGYRRPRTVA